ncbi:MAG TPA: ATP-binding cassette domain-containing protein, partial [Thermoanaerobaculia bacterium]|nr:ATP-binding cassette domain-containing protein [Thermoanaerobaculia bacterium]
MRRGISLDALAWPADRLTEALHLLARTSGLNPRTAEAASGPPAADPETAGRWIEAVTAAMGLEAEPVETPYAEVESMIRKASPVVLCIVKHGESRFLALAGHAGRRKVLALDLDGRLRCVPVGIARDALCHDLEARVAPEVDRLLEEAGVPERRRPRARAAILAERLGQVRVGGGWLLDLPPDGSLWREARRARLPRYAGWVVGAHALQHILLLLSWWMLGYGVFAGRLDWGWLLAWTLLLLTVAPFRALELWCAGVLTTRAGSLLKRRLMTGVLRLEPEEIRHQGAGQLLGRVLSSDALESLLLTGGHVGLISLVEIVLAFPILAAGTAGWPHALLLLAWVVLALLLCRCYYLARRAWTEARLGMTHDLVEKMVGHRTRLAQQEAGLWHEREDRDLEDYLRLSSAMDRRAALLKIAIPRGWLIASLAAIAPAFVSGRASAASLAVSLGGMLFAYKSFWKLVRGLSDLTEAAISWHQVEPIFRASRRGDAGASPLLALTNGSKAPVDDAAEAPVVLEGHELVYRYGERTGAALSGCSLTIRPGERLLLEGPSGGGKSTLASLLVGLRVPESGLLLLQGLDRHSLGAEGWHRRAVAAPQFQENHVL